MSSSARPLDVERWVLTIVAGASAVVVWRPAFDPFSIPKATLVVLAAVALLALGAQRVVATGRISLAVAPATIAAAAFVLALVVATVTSDRAGISVVGAYKRYGGLALYASCALLLISAARSFDVSTIRRLGYGFLVGGGIAVVYGVMQALGIEPYNWQNLYGDSVFSFLGNPNFAGAYAGMTVSFGLWAVADRNLPVTVRAAGGVVTLASVVTAWQSNSVQGVAALGLGATVFAVAWLLAGGGKRARTAAAGIVASAAVATGLLLAGLAELGPLAVLGERRTLQLRRYYWDAAVQMFADQPLFGVGLARYSASYRAYRSQEAALNSEFTVSADAPHNVPLDMFAEGGLLLGVAYLAVVLLTGWAIVSGFRRLRGPDLLVLGAFAASWAAYQLQSLVSIDVAPLAAAHWLLSGAVIAIARPPAMKVLTLPWAATPPPPAKGKGKGKGNKARPVQRPSDARRGVAWGVAAIVLLVGAWAATRPIRADIALAESRRAVQSGDVDAGLEAAQRSEALSPWEPTYSFQHAVRLIGAERPQDASTAVSEALERDPLGLEQVVTGARLADVAGDVERADELYDRALQIEPHAPELKLEVATFKLSSGQEEEGLELAEELVEARPENPELWILLARAEVANDDEGGARRALERALEISPDNAEARQLLDQLV